MKRSRNKYSTAEILCSYECCRCHKKWRGPKMGPKLCCKFCGHLYVKWLNYAELRKELGWP